MTKIISATLASITLTALLLASAPVLAQTSQQKQLVGKPVAGLSHSLNNDDDKQKTWKERREETRKKMKNKRNIRKDRASNTNSEEQRTASTDNAQPRTKTTNKKLNQRKATEHRANNRQAQKAGSNTAGKNLND